MEGFKKNLIAKSMECFMSVGDLIIGPVYPITEMMNQETQYGKTTNCILEDGESGVIKVYLPRSITVSDDEHLIQ